MNQTPSLGRIVHYTLDADDARQINRRRTDTRNSTLATQRTGAQLHVGNDVNAGEVVSAVITRVGYNYINVKCLLDGNDDYWKPSLALTPADDLQGAWAWPPRV